MVKSRLPTGGQNRSLLERPRRLCQIVIAPHSSIQDLTLTRRAQFLNETILILIILLPFGLAIQLDSTNFIYSLLGILMISFLFGKSKYPRIGILLFSPCLISVTYLSLFFGFASEFLPLVLTVVPISLIIASELVSRRAFSMLAIYATTLTILAPYYSKVPILYNDIPEASGIVLSTGVILYGVITLRERLEKSRLEENQALTLEMREIKSTLEKRVDDGQGDLARANQQLQGRAMRLKFISDLSQEISANIELQQNELLVRITCSISEKLGFYHVGIFLLDENREYAILHAANSEGGRRMLESHHQLRVGGTGIVGYVAQSGLSRIAVDTDSDAIFFNNPNLPRTRSEISLPIKYGNTVLGVLDVQSTIPSSFTVEDMNVLSTLSNQIALVVNSGNSYNNLSRTNEMMAKNIHSFPRQEGFHSLPDGTISTDLPSPSPIFEKALASGETEMTAQPSTGNPSTLAVPVKFRGQVIGVIHIQAAEEKRIWTENEVLMVQSISDRAALALESARLFEETRSRATREHIVSDITNKIRSTNDPQEMIQTAIIELQRVLGATRIEVIPQKSESRQDRTG